MKTLNLKIKVKDDIDAYKILSRVSFLAEVLEANYEGKKYQFSKEDKTKLTRYFLRANFGKQEVLSNHV